MMTMTIQRAIKPLLSGLLGSVIFMLSLSTTTQASSAPTITLIIDDIGYNLRNGLRAVNLPGAVNYAVLPHTPYSKRLAKAAHQQGKIVMLHAPMTNIHQREPGPGTLSPDMDQASFIKELNKSLAVIPFVQGINNHMGSQLTQDKTRMQWLMEEANKRKLFFIDSRTTAASVAETTARENGVPSMSRDVFLDHIRTPKAVNEAFELLLRTAKRKGHAIGIGHPHRVTLDMLEARLPELKKQGIRLVSVPSQLLAMGQAYDTQPNIMPAQITVPPTQITVPPTQMTVPASSPAPSLDSWLDDAPKLADNDKTTIINSVPPQIALSNPSDATTYKIDSYKTSDYKSTIYKAAIVRKKLIDHNDTNTQPPVSRSAVTALQRQRLVAREADSMESKATDNSATNNDVRASDSRAVQKSNLTDKNSSEPQQPDTEYQSYQDASLQQNQEPQWLKPILTQHWETPTYRSTPSLNSTPN